MAEPIRYGIIGSGMMGTEHILNIRISDGRGLGGDGVPLHAARRAPIAGLRLGVRDGRLALRRVAAAHRLLEGQVLEELSEMGP